VKIGSCRAKPGTIYVKKVFIPQITVGRHRHCGGVRRGGSAKRDTAKAAALSVRRKLPKRRRPKTRSAEESEGSARRGSFATQHWQSKR